MNAHDETFELARRYVEGSPTAEETRALEAALRSDAAFRREFMRYLQVDAALGRAMPAKVLRFPVALRWALAAAAAIVAALLVWQAQRPAVEMVRGVGQRFARAEPAGEWLGRSCELEAGWVELSFRQAEASVVIEAPARFSIEGANTLRIERGRVTAHVRNGRQGLRVLTPQIDVRDLGTRFAVEARDDKRSEVHVFEGKVEAGRAGSPQRELLTANEALRFATARAPESRDVRTGTFFQPEEMQPLAAALRAGQPGRWERAVAALKNDPALLAWIGFERQPASDRIEHGGEVRGARWVQGRFAGKSALEFVDAEDHALLNLEGRARALTLMSWVRLDRVSAGRSGLLMVNAGVGSGGVLWLVDPRGRMHFALRDQPPAEAPGDSQRPRSAVSVFGNLQVWTHLAVTYEADAQRVRFFVNGQFDSEVHTTAGLDAVLGRAILGNTASTNRFGTGPYQRLSGRMDELVALGRALSSAEVRQFYISGDPYR